MSKDIVLLVRERPDSRSISALAGGGEQAAWPVELWDHHGRLVVTVEAPVLVEAPGEVERLLGVRAEPPLWWVDVRAAVGVPDAEPFARTLAAGLAELLGGVAWSRP